MTENKRYSKRSNDRSSRKKTQTIEDRIKDFILRNSKNGYYTKVSTLSYKFEILQDKAWEIVGELLTDGLIESIHDEFTGEMKLCEAGKTYLILNLEQQRKRQKSQEFKMSARRKSKKN
jgi:predicted house-cleaning noncanonical NTP pyrophosphatase (MazG superfamily)